MKITVESFNHSPETFKRIKVGHEIGSINGAIYSCIDEYIRTNMGEELLDEDINSADWRFWVKFRHQTLTIEIDPILVLNFTMRVVQ